MIINKTQIEFQTTELKEYLNCFLTIEHYIINLEKHTMIANYILTSENGLIIKKGKVELVGQEFITWYETWTTDLQLEEKVKELAKF